ncbi:MAG: ribosomal-protein-alanine N-acetyltransferase [Chloroflexi bacterium]|nr:ribosomal-protein-alanine N-acetyltransferase [Chloroflexota bacterium]
MVKLDSVIAEMPTRYTVRPMQKEDIPQVSAIDREAFPDQWPPPPFRRDLDNNIVRYLVALEEGDHPHPRPEITAQKSKGTLRRLISRLKRLFLRESPSADEKAAQNQDTVIGYAAMWLMVDEAHLTSIAVRGTHRRLGIGELLLICMMDLALQLKAQVMTLETRVSNLEAQALYEKYGFAKVGMRRRYYSDNGEDAVIMTTDRITSASYQAKLRELRQRYVQRWQATREIPPA